MRETTPSYDFLRGIWKENPVLIQMLGLCPALAVTNTVANSLAMGGATFGAITLVLRGYQTWRRAASDTSEIVLCGLGIDRDEARRLSEAEFEPLPRLSAFSGA